MEKKFSSSVWKFLIIFLCFVFNSDKFLIFGRFYLYQWKGAKSDFQRDGGEFPRPEDELGSTLNDSEHGLNLQE